MRSFANENRSAPIPRLGQGGVAARSRKFREATLASRRRGGSFNYRLIGGLNQPPRPLHQRRLRDIFLDVASTPPWAKAGNTPPQTGRPNRDVKSINVFVRGTMPFGDRSHTPSASNLHFHSGGAGFYAV